MKSIRFIILFCIFVVFCSVSFSQKEESGYDRSEFMFVDEIKAGMTGYGLTVFEGSQVEKFGVEILGVMPNSFSGMDMILAKLDSPYLKDIGVVAGMSGSPVFLNDKMIGAVAYGWGFMKTPYCGITPIENMLEIYELTDDKPHPPIAAPTEDFLQQWESGEMASFKLPQKPPSITIKREDLKKINFDNKKIPESLTLEPLSTPLVISGCHPAVKKRIEHYLSDTPFTPVFGGGGFSGNIINPQLEERPIQNGSPLAVPMVTGDMEFSAIGTVTYRKGNKLVGFGHPFYQMGNVNMPMASAHIFTIVPSIMRPFKLGASVREIGSLRQDRRPAIGGYFGMDAPKFDVSMKVRNKSSDTEKEYNFSIWEDRMLAPMFTDIVLSETIIDQFKLVGVGAADIKYKITLDDGTILEKQNFYSTDMVLAFQASLPVFLDVNALLNNSFKQVDIKDIEFEVEIIDQYKAIGIEAVQLDKEVYKPGDTVKISVYFLPFRNDRFNRVFEMKLPEDLRNGTYNLGILNGDFRTRLLFQRSPGFGRLYSFEGLIENLEINYPLNKLYLALSEAEAGLRLYESELPGLPQSILSTAKDASVPAFTMPINLKILKEKVIDTDFEIIGSHSVTLKIDQMGRR